MFTASLHENVSIAWYVFFNEAVAGSGAFGRAEHIASEAGSSLVGTIAGESLRQCVVKHQPL